MQSASAIADLARRRRADRLQPALHRHDGFYRDQAMTYGLAQGRVATLRQTTAFVSLFDLSGLSASDRFGSWLCENARAGWRQERFWSGRLRLVVSWDPYGIGWRRS